VLFERNYREAMALATEARDYLAGLGRNEAQALPVPARLAYSVESMRMTTRIVQALAWLLAVRAVHVGELATADLAKPRWRLGARDLCLAPVERTPAGLPAALQSLMDRAENLYRRVARLDDQAAAAALGRS